MAKTKVQKTEVDKVDKNATPQWKYLAFASLFAFPAFIYVFEAFMDVFKSFRAGSGLPSYIYITCTALLIIFIWIYVRISFGSSVKYIVLIALPFLVFPSFQVYLCSPVLVVNKDFGTIFKLGTTAAEMSQYCGESCLQKSTKLFYTFSFLTPHITLKVAANEFKDLNISTNSLKGGESLKNSWMYLTFSFRSVRGKLHPLAMITRVPVRSKKILDVVEKKHSIEMTGKVIELPAGFKELKGNLEKSRLFVRPVIFEAYRIILKDKEE